MPNAWATDFTKVFHHSSYPAIAPTRPEISASGKSVLITGGGRGLGTGIVRAFAEAGASNIIITGRTIQTLQATATEIGAAHSATRISVVTGDVSVEEDVAKMFAQAKKMAPAGVDVVIANAGYLPEVMPVSPAATDSDELQKDQATNADWWRAYEVNVKGVYLLARQFLRASGPGAVFINVAAAGCHLNPPILQFSHYMSAKLAAARVIETLQGENPERRFYNVHPGVVKTDMLTKSGLEALGGAMPLDDGELAQTLRAM